MIVVVIVELLIYLAENNGTLNKQMQLKCFSIVLLLSLSNN